MIAPVGRGQRGLIVSQPKAGKTTLIKNIERSIEKIMMISKYLSYL